MPRQYIVTRVIGNPISPLPKGLAINSRLQYAPELRLRKRTMEADLAKHAALLLLEAEIFDALTQAYRQDDHDVAERLYRIWIKLPNQRPWPIGHLFQG